MTYEVKFLPSALKEWRKLPPPLQRQFQKKLRERAEQPHVPASQLRGHPKLYKVKLRSAGYRLVYKVSDKEIIVYVIAVGRRERGAVYRVTAQRLTP